MQFAELWPGGPRYTNGDRAFPLTADSIILADFAPGKTARRVVDIGCGSGIIGLLIAWNNGESQITGVDILEAAVKCACDNFTENRLDRRFHFLHGDIMNVPLPECSFDLAVCNPPYFEKGRGKPGSVTREESTAPLGDIIKRASKLLVYGGSLCIVIRPGRLVGALEAMAEFGFSPSRLRLVAHTEKSEPSMALIEALLGGGPELMVLLPLILKNEHGGDSDEIKRIYHMI